MRYAHPYEMKAEPVGGFTVTFPDVPEAITHGRTEVAAREMADDALMTALTFYSDAGRPLPRLSPKRGWPLATVPVLVAAKLALHEAMLDAKISNVELGRRLKRDEKAVRRLRDPLHRSHINQVETALGNLGRRLDIAVRDAA